MKKRKKLKRIILVISVLVLAAIVWIASGVFPAVSGYGSKNLCSAVYLQHRNPADVIREDLGSFPLSLGSFVVNKEDSSVTGSVWGFAKRKTIYRNGIGCTLINDFTEEEVRKQQFDLPAKPNINTDTIPWPYGDKLPDSISSKVDKEKLNQALDNVFSEVDEDGESVHTRAVLVVYDGNIIGERYAPGFGKNTVMLGWSMSKSLTAAMTGLLVKEGKLTVDAPAPVPSWKGTDKEKITLKNLLQQTTGLDFLENYERPSEVTDMLFSKGDMAAFTEARPLKYVPGTVFNYSSGNSNVLSAIIRRTVGEKEYHAFPYDSLFYKINAYSFLLEPDASGTYIGSSYSYATARDFARFGLLYYNNGRWNGRQVLPENWVQQTIQPSSADKLKQYGYQFWLNGFSEEDASKKAYPDVPSDMFYADGYGGQFIYIIPSRKMVIVRLGLHKNNQDKFLKEVLAAVMQ